MGCQGKTVPGCDQKRHRDDPRQTVCEGVDQVVPNKADQSDKYASKNVYSGMLPEQFATISSYYYYYSNNNDDGSYIYNFIRQ